MKMMNDNQKCEFCLKAIKELKEVLLKGDNGSYFWSCKKCSIEVK